MILNCLLLLQFNKNVLTVSIWNALVWESEGYSDKYKEICFQPNVCNILFNWFTQTYCYRIHCCKRSLLTVAIDFSSVLLPVSIHLCTVTCDSELALMNQLITNTYYVWMWELDCEESWAPKNWCFWTVVLEKTLESPLNCKEIQPVHSEGDQPWDFFGGNDAKAETPVLWTPHVKSWLIGKDSDAGRD